MHSPFAIAGEFVGQGINSVRSTPYTMHHIDVRIEKDVYDANNTLADNNAKHLKAHGVRAFDLLGAIGSGKTALIERLVPLLEKKGLKSRGNCR